MSESKVLSVGSTVGKQSTVDEQTHVGKQSTVGRQSSVEKKKKLHVFPHTMKCTQHQDQSECDHSGAWVYLHPFGIWRMVYTLSLFYCAYCGWCEGCVAAQVGAGERQCSLPPSTAANIYVRFHSFSPFSCFLRRYFPTSIVGITFMRRSSLLTAGMTFSSTISQFVPR
jgi:hypothetical protein